MRYQRKCDGFPCKPRATSCRADLNEGRHRPQHLTVLICSTVLQQASQRTIDGQT